MASGNSSAVECTTGGTAARLKWTATATSATTYNLSITLQIKPVNYLFSDISITYNSAWLNQPRLTIGGVNFWQTGKTITTYGHSGTDWVSSNYTKSGTVSNGQVLMDFALHKIVGSTTYWSVFSGGSFTISLPTIRSISFNANGGSGAPSKQYVCNGDTVTLSSTMPTRSTYRFVGWATSASGAVAYAPGQTFTVTSNLTLYAVWVADICTLSANNATMGSSTNISITQLQTADTYKFTLRYACGGTSGTIASNLHSSSTTITQAWTPPISLASETPNNKTITCTVYCDCYLNGTNKGTVTKAITLTVPSSTNPTITSATVSDVNSRPSGYTSFVAEKSKYTASMSASGQYGATIASYSITANGETKNSATFTASQNIRSTSDNSVVFKATDSRGYTTSQTVSTSVAAYSAPTANNIVMARCLSDGTIDSNGTHLLVAFKAQISALDNKNSKQYAIEYKRDSSDTWLTAQARTTLSAYDSEITFVDSTNGGLLDEAYNYDVRIAVTDFYGTQHIGGTVSKSLSIMDVMEDGVAFGKVATQHSAVDIDASWKLILGGSDLGMKIDFLSKLTLGQTFDLRSVTSNAYSVAVPQGGLCANINSIGGKSYVRNNLYDPDNMTPSGGSGISVVKNSDKSITVSGTATDNAFVYISTTRIPLTAGHKYYIGQRGVTLSNSISLRSYASNVFNSIITSGNGGIYSASVTGNTNLYFYITNGTPTNFTVKVQFVDLTLCFGSGNEPSSTSDPRLIALINYLSSHPEYDSGTLISADVVSVDSYDSNNALLGSYAIPSALRTAYPLHSKGATCDEYDFERKVFIHRVDASSTPYTVLATPVEVDISSYLTGSNLIPCKGGGTLIFAQTNGFMPIDNSVTYGINLHDAI